MKSAHKKKAEPNPQNHKRGTQVRLKHHERRGQRGVKKRNKDIFAQPCLNMKARKKTREHEHKRDLQKFGRLKMKAAENDPTLGAANCSGLKYRNEKKSDACPIQPVAKPTPPQKKAPMNLTPQKNNEKKSNKI